MKKNKLLLIALLIIIISGCKKQSLESYLQDKGYTCQKEVCSLVNEENIKTTTTTYDINNNVYSEDISYKGFAEQWNTLEYNWDKKEVKAKYHIVTSEFEISYNLNDESSYSCTSNDEDEIYSKSQCITFKEEVIEKVNNVDKIINKYIG